MNLKIKPKIANPKVENRIVYNKEVVIKNFNNTFGKIHEIHYVNNLKSPYGIKLVTKIQFDEILKKGGIFSITQDQKFVSIGVIKNSIKDAFNEVSKMLEFDIELLDLTGKTNLQTFNGNSFVYVQSTSSADYHPDNCANFKIYDSTGKNIGRFNWHPAGHIGLKNENYNASLPHFNLKIIINSKTIETHIVYNN